MVLNEIECIVLNGKAFPKQEFYDFVRPTILRDDDRYGYNVDLLYEKDSLWLKDVKDIDKEYIKSELKRYDELYDRFSQIIDFTDYRNFFKNEILYPPDENKESKFFKRIRINGKVENLTVAPDQITDECKIYINAYRVYVLREHFTAMSKIETEEDLFNEMLRRIKCYVETDRDIDFYLHYCNNITQDCFVNISNKVYQNYAAEEIRKNIGKSIDDFLKKSLTEDSISVSDGYNKKYLLYCLKVIKTCFKSGYSKENMYSLRIALLLAGLDFKEKKFENKQYEKNTVSIIL